MQDKSSFGAPLCLFYARKNILFRALKYFSTEEFYSKNLA